MVNALVVIADEGRVRLRKASRSCLKALLLEDIRMGKPGRANLCHPNLLGRAPGELKHLSNRRKRKRKRFRK